ncbi:isoprenylcysteine carboxylmethyltransferase family protein [Terrarubrum flagellatum]|uniref:methyltransferase family protein n=1 Tax=Terrirubrum flagellatum TaxID=2895980 RepID=UPI0031451EF1
MDRAELGKRAASGTIKFIIALAILVIPLAGLTVWTPWLFWAHFSLWSALLTWYFYIVDPALLERRLRGGPTAETEPAQKRIQLAISIVMIATILIAALDCRFAWSTAPRAAIILGHIFIAIGFLAVTYVLRANTFAAATIGVAENQTVISTGPYAIVRHPMYAVATPIFLGIPLALGSWWALLLAPFVIWLLAARLLDEEAYLVRNLPGYQDYREKVRFRLAPGLW